VLVTWEVFKRNTFDLQICDAQALEYSTEPRVAASV